MDDLLVDFLAETTESLGELDVALVKLERAPDDDSTLSLIFRMVHTIKGTCGFLGLPRLEKVAHSAENVLGRVRDKVLPVTPDTISNILFAIDRIKEIVAGLGANGAEPTGDDTALIAALDAIAEGRAAAAIQAAGAAASAVVAAAQAVPSAPPTPSPVATESAPTTAPISPEPEKAPQPEKLSHTAEPAAPDPAADHTRGDAGHDTAVAGQTIRVAVDVLENLMTLVSELVLTRNQLMQLARRQEDSAFAVPLQRLSQITSDLQEGVMKTRMQPIGNAWNKLPRLVRDLARDLSKKVELQMLGAETELDRQVLELIKDPLTHMVRNSVDHGLESPAQRRAAGKPETGRITLNAFHEGGHIFIEIADDGAGLSLQRIRAKAVANGLATEPELAGMTDAQIQRFIFRAGFSTAATITSVSGRGVGMDVVKTNIERIGGSIDLKSVEGSGTTFTIKIPLTLAIVSALIVEAGGERFAIPQISVVELVRARVGSAPGAAETDSRIELINDTPVLRLRDRLLPLIGLNDLLQLAPRARQEAPTSPGSSENSYIIVAQVGASVLGIIVDRVFDTEEIVVKPVAPILRHITMFSGNTILGDGSVIMILDPNGIARASGIAGSSETRTTDRRSGTHDASNTRSSERTAMLLFRADGGGLKAVPLGLVARLEDIPRDRIEMASGGPVTQYRGRLMPLVPMGGSIDLERASHPILVFSDTERGSGRDRSMGLVVEEIVDVIDERLKIELSGARTGVLGTAVVAGRATDVIDTSHWLTQAFGDWFRGTEVVGAEAKRILVVEDSDFFRQLLIPALAAAGYDVTGAADAAEALRLHDAGTRFDAIISDIAMPDMDGLAFVRRLRAEGTWKDLPVIALSGKTQPVDIAAGRAAGFTDYVGKFDRDALLASLHQCLTLNQAAHEVSF